MTQPNTSRTFSSDLDFLREHTATIVLQNGAAKIAVAPDLQGRVLTSTVGDVADISHGWINRELFVSGVRDPRCNAYGGEDRLWLGPEGGQYSLFFAPGTPFTRENWFVPAPLDTWAYDVVATDHESVDFAAAFSVKNHSGHDRSVRIDRKVSLLDVAQSWDALRTERLDDLGIVTYSSRNRLTNAGAAQWTAETGLVSLWVLGMYPATPGATVILPYRQGDAAELGKIVTDDYFGKLPDDRLTTTQSAILLKADGEHRSKLGVSIKRSLGVAGSYDRDDGVLTLIRYSHGDLEDRYVNSTWAAQDAPYAGDVLNAYNDGPDPGTGARLGAFHELESSSPALELMPDEWVEHTHTTAHLTGEFSSLSRVARSMLGVDLAEIDL